MLEAPPGDGTVHDRLLDEAARDTVGYMFRPWDFSVGDTCLFLPPTSHRAVWADLSQLYSQPGVVLKRVRGVTAVATDDEYDVLFNISGVATAIQALPAEWLQHLGLS